MKLPNNLYACISIACISLMSGCVNIPDPIGKDFIGEYNVTFTYEVFDPPWEGGASHTIVNVDKTFRIELSDTSGNFIIRTTLRNSTYILAAEYQDGMLNIPLYYFYPPGMTAHDIQGNISFKDDSIFVELNEAFWDWPYGGTFYDFVGKGVRK